MLGKAKNKILHAAEHYLQLSHVIYEIGIKLQILIFFIIHLPCSQATHMTPILLCYGQSFSNAMVLSTPFFSFENEIGVHFAGQCRCALSLSCQDETFFRPTMPWKYISTHHDSFWKMELIFFLYLLEGEE